VAEIQSERATLDTIFASGQVMAAKQSSARALTLAARVTGCFMEKAPKLGPKSFLSKTLKKFFLWKSI
jgi:hypothetical protein